MLYYNPQHVSSSTLLIFRRKNCIITVSGIVTLEVLLSFNVVTSIVYNPLPAMWKS